MSTFKRTVSIEVDKGIEQIMAVGGLKKACFLDSSRGSTTILENERKKKASGILTAKHTAQRPITESHSKKQLYYEQAAKIVDSG
mmetsp:Transcript_15200/g.23479  ORF Transcript_15200/g.23479 Transcript_15200/m.23479 type:complete len:85 (-) Transcript_15200:1044-1298(-)